MKESVSFGMNKTPTQLHPAMTEEMAEGYKEFPPTPQATEADVLSLRESYIRDSEPLGSVPIPATLKGGANAGLQFLKGNSPSVFIDKLGERLAYERSGTRLYEAFIIKCQILKPSLSTVILERFHDEELAHYHLLWDCMLEIGADPTAQTPCADASGVASMGLLQLVNDPRSTISQCADAILIAELTDVAAWDLLISLSREAGLESMSARFAAAKAAEDEHLATIKQWIETMILENSAVPIRVY